MRWTRGEQAIRDLLDAGELRRVPGAVSVAPGLLAAARTHTESAAVITGLDPDGAYQLYCDAAHKSAESLLQIQGLRPTTKGGRLAVKDAVVAQFGRSQAGEVFRRLGRMRHRNVQLDFPAGNPDHIDPEELREAQTWALQILDVSSRLIPRLDPF
jgi:hypothetical protein